MNDWIRQLHVDAAAKVAAELVKPLPDDKHEIGGDDTFDPWALFPCFYGSYSSEFDETALEVLHNLQCARDGYWESQTLETLPHHMFREVLCRANLCDYGASPRVCFATPNFGQMLDELSEKWAAFSAIQWGVRE